MEKKRIRMKIIKKRQQQRGLPFFFRQFQLSIRKTVDPFLQFFHQQFFLWFQAG